MTKQVNHRLDTIVIGSGPSGLAAAYTLQKSGANVKVLEKVQQLGGKLCSKSENGYTMEQGALFATSGYTALLKLAEEVGVADDIVPARFVLGQIRDGTVHHLDGNKLVSSFLSTKLLSPQAKLEAVFKLLPEFIRARKANYNTIPSCGDLEKQSVAEWAQATFSPELRTYLVEGILRGMFGTRSQTASRVDFLALLNILSGAKLMAFENGMSAYAHALARQVDVQCNAEVIHIEDCGNGVSVTWRDANGNTYSDTAKSAVIAVPAVTARQIYPGLDAWRQHFLGKVKNGKQVVLSIGLSEPPANIFATYIMVPEPSHPFVSGIMVDHNKMPGRVPEGKGLLSIAAMDYWCEENWQRSDEELSQMLLGAVDSLIPDTKANCEFLELNRWFLEYSQPGFYRDLGEFRERCELDTRIQLAGDFHSMGGLDAATRTGIAAAGRILSGSVLAL